MMSNDLNPNAIASSALAEFIQKSFESTARGLAKQFTTAWNKLFEDFDPFMREAYQRNRFIRILCKKDQDVDLYNVYVNGTFKHSADLYDDEQVIHHVRERKNIVVVGSGGAGKTCFMRHLWLTIFTNPNGLTPIFLELRKMNDLTTTNLKSFIRASISRSGLNEELFDYFCTHGRFCFILDGFDEITQSKQDSIDYQIKDLAAEFPTCAIVVSSRDDQRFAGWQNFDVFTSEPLGIMQCKELVKKVPFHEDTKKLFLKQLTLTFFMENRSFLSNPLLTVMMLMTFKDNMETPASLTIFYDQALNTLHQWHDSTKNFKREKTLDIDEFKRSFGMFCLISYYRQMFEFTASEIHETILDSNRANGYSFDPELVLWDYEKAVNLVRQDGLLYVFIHRSFQEYFAALAMTRFVPKSFPEFLPLVLQRTSDNVLQLCYELDRDLVLQHFVGSALQSLEQWGFSQARIGSSFKALEYAGVSFDLHFSKDKGKFHPSSLSAPVSSEFRNIFNNLLRLASTPVRELHEILLTQELFQELGDVAEIAQAEHLRVTFKNGKIHCSTSVGTTFKQAGTELATRVEAKKAAFQLANKRLATTAKTLMQWATAEVENQSARGKSLSEILGLPN